MKWRTLLSLSPRRYTISEPMIKETLRQVKENHKYAETALAENVREFLELRDKVMEERKAAERHLLRGLHD